MYFTFNINRYSFKSLRSILIFIPTSKLVYYYLKPWKETKLYPSSGSSLPPRPPCCTATFLQWPRKDKPNLVLERAVWEVETRGVQMVAVFHLTVRYRWILHTGPLMIGWSCVCFEFLCQQLCKLCFLLFSSLRSSLKAALRVLCLRCTWTMRQTYQ